MVIYYTSLQTQQFYTRPSLHYYEHRTSGSIPLYPVPQPQKTFLQYCFRQIDTTTGMPCFFTFFSKHLLDSKSLPLEKGVIRPVLFGRFPEKALNRYALQHISQNIIDTSICRVKCMDRFSSLNRCRAAETCSSFYQTDNIQKCDLLWSF